jgi:acetyl-CoA C-acetyltransferase
MEHKPVYIVDGLRTPFIKFQGKPNSLSATELADAAVQPLLLRQAFKPSDIEEVVVGCVAPAADEANIARIIALRAGCGEAVPAFTVQRNCASGLQALDSAVQNIRLGRYDLVLAGGTEAMSRAPLLFPESMSVWLANLQASKGIVNKLKAWVQFRPHFLKPVIGLLKALTDPVINLSMGQTAEELAYRFEITREQMDAYSVQSHLRTLKDVGIVVPVYDFKGNVIEYDEGVRKDSNIEKLSTLKPVFDKPFGKVTAGNSSQVSDGAAFLILASEAAVKRYDLNVRAKIIDTAWAAVDPVLMGLGPVYAIASLLKNQGLTLADIDYVEINEAFAAQVLACVKVLEQEGVGVLPLDRLNIEGGAIAIGHPVGASGARLAIHMVDILERHQAQRGIVSLCIGGGQGGAMLIERVTGAKS